MELGDDLGAWKDAESPTVSALAVTAAAELAEAAVRRAEEAHADAEFRAPGEGSLAAGVSTPFAEDVTNLVDRLLAGSAAEGEGGGEERRQMLATTATTTTTTTTTTEGGQRRADAYSEVVRDRVLRRLEAGVQVTGPLHPLTIPRIYISLASLRRRLSLDTVSSHRSGSQPTPDQHEPPTLSRVTHLSTVLCLLYCQACFFS